MLNKISTSNPRCTVIILSGVEGCAEGLLLHGFRQYYGTHMTPLLIPVFSGAIDNLTK